MSIEEKNKTVEVIEKLFQLAKDENADTERNTIDRAKERLEISQCVK